MESTATKEKDTKATPPAKEGVKDVSATAGVPTKGSDTKARSPHRMRNVGRAHGKRRRGGRRDDRRPEFDSKIISIRRVTRVVAGGRRFSFSVALVAGDHKGRVGVGTGKATDTALVIEKAMRDAKKRMMRVTLSKEMRIPHGVKFKYCASVILLSPSPGRGVAAGSSVRTVLELADRKSVV